MVVAEEDAVTADGSTVSSAQSLGGGGEGGARVLLEGGLGGGLEEERRRMEQFVGEVEARIWGGLQQAAAVLAAQLDADAAARAAAAERKVAYMEQELMNVKEQALSMLLNVKHASDAQAYDLEKQLFVEKRRAEDAEAKVSGLQELVMQLKKGKQHQQQRGEGDDVADSLFLIAGVACDVAADDPRDAAKLLESSSKSPPDKLQAAQLQHQQQQQQQFQMDDGEEDEVLSSESPEEEPSSDDHPPRQSRASRKRRKSSSKRAAASSDKVNNSSSSSRLCKRTRGGKSSSSVEIAGDGGGGKIESSRDSRRLMQGARQLFSLAEKKWR